ncbi:MAG: hypothetical protein IIZ37_05585 [Acinetobacter sp.]|nr:hypothetical protein [Acinetobacter sp.]
MRKMLFAATLAVLSVMNAHAAPDANKRLNHNQLCQGKEINSKVNINNNGRDIQGTCQLGFKPDQVKSLERGEMRDPSIQKACLGKSKGAPATITVNGKSINGKCDVVFKPNRRS